MFLHSCGHVIEIIALYALKFISADYFDEIVLQLKAEQYVEYFTMTIYSLCYMKNYPVCSVLEFFLIVCGKLSCFIQI